jgi:hypothetical protein
MRIGLIIFAIWCFYLMKHAEGNRSTDAVSWESESSTA